MTSITKLNNIKKMDELKKKVGGGDANLRRRFDASPELTAEDGTVTPAKTAYENANAAWEGVKAFAEANGLAIFERPADAFVEGWAAVIAVLGARVDNDSDGKKMVGAEGVALYPVPTVAAYQAFGGDALAFLEKVTEKESAHVFHRAIRGHEVLEELVEAFATGTPSSIEQFIADNSGAGGGAATADTIWPDTRDWLKTNIAALYNKLPPKADTFKAIKSKAFAEKLYGSFEQRGVFAYIGQIMILLAEGKTDPTDNSPAPLDTTALKSWLENRDTVPAGMELGEGDEIPDLSAAFKAPTTPAAPAETLAS